MPDEFAVAKLELAWKIFDASKPDGQVKAENQATLTKTALKNAAIVAEIYAVLPKTP